MVSFSISKGAIIMADYVVNFIKDENYKRFNLSGILTKNSRGIYAIDLYEESIPLIKRFVVEDSGNTSTQHEDGDLVNYIHASVTIDPNNLPGIISNLQKMYESYIEEKSPNSSESGE